MKSIIKKRSLVKKERLMTKIIKAVLLIATFAIVTVAFAASDKPGTFSSFVDSKGNIILPANFRSTWVHLGSWAVPSRWDPGSGFHDVYTQPESYQAYKKTGKWPDGAVLVKEIRTVKWDDMPTGHVVYADEKSSWFVMVKDSRNRFKDNPNWGEGWGWALFKANDPKKNVSTNYKEDCLSCHEPAKETDWVFIQGYPTLK